MRALPFLVLTATACGGGGAGSASASYPFPEPRLMGEGASKVPASLCAGSSAYSEQTGCVYPASDAVLRVDFRDEIPATFVLVGVAFALDGAMVFESNDPALLARRRFPVTATGLGAGRHELAVRLLFRGHGYGVFSYLRGYRFQAQGFHALDARRGSTIGVTVVAHERGDALTPVEERPALRFEDRAE